jgi:Transposase IS200 like
MAECRHSGQAVCDLKYHFVWITKYRYKILRGEVAERARDLIRQMCHAREVVIVRGSVSLDHIQMLVSAHSPGSLQACAIHQGPIVAHAAGGIPELTEALLGGNICGGVDTFAGR